MKKKILIISYIFIVSIMFSLLISTPIKNELKKRKLKVGQTWIYRYNKENPYEPIIICHMKIIDMSGDYVLYVKDGEDTLSISKRLFVYESELVDEK